MNGFIKLHRKIMESQTWIESTPEQKVLMITCLLLASYTETEWFFNDEKYSLKPGQFITSTRSLAKKSGLTHQLTRTFLKKFEKLEFLTQKPTRKNTLITICNWGVYQGEIKEANTPTNTDLTQHPPKANTQSNNYQEIKNNKKENKNIELGINSKILKDDSSKIIEENKELSEFLMKKYGFTETANFDKLRMIGQAITLLHNTGQLEKFRNQTYAYFTYKEDTKERVHNLKSYLGDLKENCLDGGWNAENWVEKLPEKQSSTKIPKSNDPYMNRYKNTEQDYKELMKKERIRRPILKN